MINFVLIFVTLVFSAFFSGMEIAFISSNKLRIELDKKKGIFPSRIIAIFAKNPGQYIATMLVGNNIALVIYGLVMAIILDPVIKQYITDTEISILLIQTLISTLIILISAEFLPKTLFRINPNASLNIFSIPVVIFYFLFYPITQLTVKFSNFLLKKFLKVNTEKNNKQKIIFGKVDLDHFLNENKQPPKKNEKVDSEIKYFQNALDFSKLKIRECMIPRNEIVAINVNKSLKKLKEKFTETGLSKIVIYENSIDNIIGYFHSSDLFRNPENIRSKIIMPTIVPETMFVSNLLGKLIQTHKSMAVVVDEFGGTSGIITIEDIIEEIFGEIEDEHDKSELYEEQLAENKYMLSGRLEIDHVNEKHNLSIPVSEDYETIAGFILFNHNNIPKLNDEILIPPFTFKILKVSRTQIKLVELEIISNE